MKKWQCTVCKYIHEGDEPPEKCPICGVPASKFVLLEDDGPGEGVEAAKAAGSKPLKKTERTPVSAKLKAPAEPAVPPPAPEPATPWEKLTQTLVKHHAHPVSVHMPNGILPVSVVLFILAWLFDSNLFAKAGFINLVFVVLALPIVLFSGVLEWKLKYNQALTPVFKIKILAASITCSACLISVIWFIFDPRVIASSKAWVFILLNLVMLAAAGLAGHIGGKLVFKD